MIYSESSNEVISQIKMIELTQNFGIPTFQLYLQCIPRKLIAS